ncbi:ATP-binding protein [Endozoicomonas sp. 4G]|uniref:AAA family ATPase n=1 Tax=Endozoicomonas sp. 4G TaxID=2872754 RepID=UPI002078F642|nr:ATP-binding protein [Endozoicomonas sp. 4G]
MISNFKINNFRLFGDVEINNLNRVNLIVGKNGSGKSALLEGFLLYFSRVSPDSLHERLHCRQEHWESQQSKYTQQLLSNPIRHLFKGHTIPDINKDGFKLSSDKETIHVKTAAYIREETENGITRRMLLEDEVDECDPDFLEKYIVSETNGSYKILFSLNSEYRDIKRRSINFKKNDSIPYQFVPTDGIDDSLASLLWDGISLTELEKEVLKGVKLVEPNAMGITFVENSGGVRSPSRIPLVKLKNIAEPVPLKSLGDGMSRIFQIILSLVSAKGGVLIVDEFENGLHWSIQDDVWDIVFKLASKLNIQVFCSTHSRDCINSFENTWKSYKKSASFIRVFKNEGISSVKEYDLELLSDSLETDLEVR